MPILNEVEKCSIIFNKNRPLFHIRIMYYHNLYINNLKNQPYKKYIEQICTLLVFFLKIL